MIENVFFLAKIAPRRLGVAINRLILQKIRENILVLTEAGIRVIWGPLNTRFIVLM